MALVRTKLRRRLVAVAFVLATMIGLGAVGAKPASADTPLCFITIPTEFSQGGFQFRGLYDASLPLMLHVFYDGRWQQLTWREVMAAQFVGGVWFLGWGAIVYVPDSPCAAYVT